MMRRTHSNFRNHKKLFLFSFFFGFSLIFGLFLGISAVNPTTPSTPSFLGDDDDVPLTTSQIGNLTRQWEPIVLTIADIPQLQSLSWGNIRVAYYMIENATWISVPFQIDEVGFYLGHPEGQYISPSIPGAPTGIAGYTGLDADGMDFLIKRASVLILSPRLI